MLIATYSKNPNRTVSKIQHGKFVNAEISTNHACFPNHVKCQVNNEARKNSKNNVLKRVFNLQIKAEISGRVSNVNNQTGIKDNDNFFTHRRIVACFQNH